MNVQTQAVSAALALYPVYLPQWVTPVLPSGTADGGIPQAAFNPLGVEMVIEPFTGLLNWAMAAYDVVTIYVNGVSTNVAKTIYPGEENDRFLLLVPASWFVNGVNEIFYKVKRVSGNFDDSQKLNVLYHDPAPGEPAPAGLTIVFPPNIVANGVGPADAAVGVPVTFIISFARPFDEILLVVGTWSTTITVTDPAQPITRTLTAADFQQIGDNANTPVKCTVTDQLGNGNQSATTYLNIHVNEQLITPTLDHVKDANGNEVEEGQQTASTTLKMEGKASKGKQVEIFDGSGASAVSKGTATADATTGIWERTITVAVGARRLYAKSLYHPSNTYSNVRNLTVIQPLHVEPSLLVLHGEMIRSGYCKYPTGVDATGNTAVRQASGGSPPYTYKSSNTAAVVDAYGKVTGMANGSGTITITDSQGAQVSYSVSVANIYEVFGYHQSSPPAKPWTYAAYAASLPNLGYIGLTPSLRAVLQRCYHHPWFEWQKGPGDTPGVWSGGSAGEALNIQTGLFYRENLNSHLTYGVGFSRRAPVGASAMTAAQTSGGGPVFMVQPAD